ncbi:MAG: molybdopterin-dependent oxidoreductase [Chloroflexia bacterium]|nr:molybdopterin-dependent oxidoreductase [Chloroflexia bacterium]
MEKLWAGLRYVPNLLAGLVAGLAAAAVTTLLMALSRYYLGIMPPPEAVPDRIAPMLDIDTFFSLFSTYGGYNGLKQFGIVAGLRTLFATGAVVGVIFAIVAEIPPVRRSPKRMLGIARPAFLFMAIAILVVWIAFVIFLWPVLSANYRGLPYTQARIVSIVALLLWFGAFGATVAGLYRFIVARTWRAKPGDEEPDAASKPEAGRGDVRPRRAVLAAAGGAVLAWPIYGLLRRMYDDATFTYDGTVYSGPGVQPLTPTEDFYCVTKNVVDPDVNRDLWRLEIAGHVDSPHTYSFDDLQEFEQVEQETTLMCISNQLGAGLFSNANWRGVRMRDLIEASGLRDGAYEVVINGVDAYRDTFDIEKAMAEETLVVYEINGDPLPRRHGYPVRVIVPGRYGEKNVKWVTRIEVATEDVQGFYESQGWGPDFQPRTRSDIFAPAVRRPPGNVATFELQQPVATGRSVTFKGRAFSPGNGISSVEVTTDDGATWNPADIFYPGTIWTWSQWSFEWTPDAPGEYVVISRAVDGNGVPQDPEVFGIIPQGASGYMRVIARVG